MDALTLLNEQHDDVDALFAKIESADGAEKQRHFEALADRLAAHAEIEETIFYPAVMAKQTHELLVESVEEHLSIKRLLADLLELRPDDEHFAAKITVMKEQVRHHARDEEEKQLFPKVRRLMSADEVAGLGGELAAAFDQLIDKQPRRKEPSQNREAAPLPAQ